MELSQYKKAWENQPEIKNKLSGLEIYKLTQSKSTSIVKWILIIGIAEFAFWFLINFTASKFGAMEPYEKLDLVWFLNYSNYFHYVVVFLFLALFYRNYSSINIVDNTKTLMVKILRTRKTVKWYVYYNLISVVVMTIILNIILLNTPNALRVIYNLDPNLNLSDGQFFTIVIISQVIMLFIMLAFLIGLYYLLYGILLKKLNKNYKELSKLDEVT